MGLIGQSLFRGKKDFWLENWKGPEVEERAEKERSVFGQALFCGPY